MNEKTSSDTTVSSEQSGKAPEKNGNAENIPSAPRKSFARRFFKSVPARVILGLIVLYFAATLLALPFGGRWFLEKKLTEVLEVPCRIEAVRCNPFTLETRAKGIVIPYPENKGVFLSVDAVELRPAVGKTLSSLTPNLGSLRIIGPSVSLGVFKDGVFSLNAYPFAEKKAENQDQDKKNEKSEGTFPFVVNDIELVNGSVSLWDMRHNLTQNISDIQIRVPFASSLPEDRDVPVVPEARAVIDGSPVVLGASSTVFSDTVNTELNIDLGRIPIERFRSYITPYTRLNLEKAALSAVLSLKAGQLEGHDGFDVSVKGKIKVFDVSLVDPDEKKSVLSLGSGELEIERFLLHPQDISVNVLTLDRLRVSARRLADGSINWQHYFKGSDKPAGAGKPSTQTASSGESGPPPFVLKKFTLENAEIEWRDDAVPGGMSHTFKGLSASLSSLDTRGKGSATLRAALKDEDFGTLDLDGRFSLSAKTLNLKADIADFKVTALGPYLASLPVTIENGAVSTGLTADLAFAESMPLTSLAGSAKVTDIAVKDADLWQLRTKETRADNFRFTANPMTFEADSLVVETPKGSFTLLPDKQDEAARAQLKQISQQVEEIKRKEKTPKPGTAARDSGKISVEEGAAAKGNANSPLAGVDEKLGIFKTFKIGKVLVRNGAFSFKDQRVSPPSSGSLANLNMTLSNLSTAPGSKAQLSLTGLFDRAPFSARGTINPLKAPLNAAMRVELDGLNMVKLSPFAVQALAYPIESGLFTADLDIAFTNDVLRSTNRFVLENFNLGPKKSFPGAPDLPLPLAVALLKGPSGTIDLTVSADGRLDDPQFSVAGIVVKIIGNIMVKVLTSPFTLVAGIFSGDSDTVPDLSYVLFEPGSATLNKQAKTNVAAIAALLEKRPNLKLELIGMADAKDRAGLVDQFILEKMQEVKYNGLSSGARAATTPKAMIISRKADPEEYAELLYDVYNDSSLPVPRNIFGTAEKQPVEKMLAAFHENMKPTNEDLEKLALKRAEAVQKAVLAAAPKLASRVSVSKNTEIETQADDADAMTAVRLDLTAAE